MLKESVDSSTLLKIKIAVMELVGYQPASTARAWVDDAVGYLPFPKGVFSKFSFSFLQKTETQSYSQSIRT